MLKAWVQELEFGQDYHIEGVGLFNAQETSTSVFLYYPDRKTFSMIKLMSFDGTHCILSTVDVYPPDSKYIYICGMIYERSSRLHPVFPGALIYDISRPVYDDGMIVGSGELDDSIADFLRSVV